MKTNHVIYLLAVVLLVGCKSTRHPEPPVVKQIIDEQVPLSVIVKGNVKYPVIPWTEDLTVAKAILTAEYLGVRDPLTIIIRRQGDRMFVSPTRLVHGVVNPWLEPGDILEIRAAGLVQPPSLLGKYQPVENELDYTSVREP